MEKITHLFEKFLNTIKYNGLFIILSIIFPIIFYKIDAGKELILFLLNTNDIFNISLIAFMFFVLTISSWCIPILAIEFYRFVTNSKEDKYQICEKIEKNYNGEKSSTINQNNYNIVRPQLPIKIIAILPLLIFVCTLPAVFFDIDFLFIVSLLFEISLLYLTYLFVDKKYKSLSRFFQKIPEKKCTFLLYSLFFILLILCTPFFLYILKKTFGQEIFYESLIIKLWVILYFSIVLVIVYLFMLFFDKSEIDNEISEEKTEKIKFVNYKINRIIHITVIGFTILCFIIFSLLNRFYLLGVINPICISLFYVNALILFLELFVTAQFLIIKIIDNKTYKVKAYGYFILFMSLLMIYLYLFDSTNGNIIRTENNTDLKTDTFKKDTFDEYFKNWYSAKGEPEIIYLVSGQGGGSRAGAWFLMNMLLVDKANPQVYTNTFSISTVSGSTSGANMYLTYHKIYSPQTNINSNEINKFVKDIYTTNYLSSGLFGFLVSDFTTDAFMNMLENENKDRNYTLQKEEMIAFTKAYKNNINKDISENLIKTTFESDYIAPYYPQTNPNRYQHPLFMINSTVMDDGTKGIFSPIKISSFSLYRDLYSDFRGCNSSNGKALPTVTCVNQSQAFPLVNSYNYLHGSGRLGDGGFYENSGTETTLEIYKAIKNYFTNNTITKTKIICININNSEIIDKKLDKYSKVSILGTLTSIANSPLYGHQGKAFNSLRKEIIEDNNGLDDNFKTLRPKQKYTLTRMLSEKTFDSLAKEVRLKSFKTLFTPINKKDTIINIGSSNRSTSKPTEFINIFFHYNDPKLKNTAEIIKNKFNDGKEINGFSIYNKNSLDLVEINYKSNIRYFNPGDRKIAENIKKLLDAMLPVGSTPYEIKDFSNEFTGVPNRQIEVWIGK